MKKLRIIITALLSFVALFLLLGFIFHCRDAHEYIREIDIIKAQFNTQDLSPFYKRLTIEIVSLFLFLISFFIVVFVNLIQYPEIFRIEYWKERKQERLAARAAKAEQDKQKRIEELQAELDELNTTKKDGTPPSED